MRRAWAPVLLLALPVAAADPPPAAEAAAKVKVAALLAALRAGDRAKAVADWPAFAPGGTGFTELLDESLLPPAGFTLKTADISYSRWDAGENALAVRVRFTAVLVGKDGAEADRDVHVLNARFARVGGGWEWASCTDAAQDVGHAVVRVAARDGTPAEAVKAVREGADLPAGQVAAYLFVGLNESIGASRPGLVPVFGAALDEVARPGTDPVARGFREFGRGRALAAGKKPAEAVAAYERAAALFDGQPGSTAWGGTILVRDYLVSALLRMYRPADALRHAEAGLRAVRKRPAPVPLLLATLYNHGTACRAAGRPADARASLREALEMIRRLPGRDDLAAEVLVELGHVELIVGDPAAAADALRQAVEAADRAKSAEHRAMAQALLAKIALDDGRYDEARDGFTAAAAALAKTDNTSWLVIARSGLGLTLLARGEAGAALTRFRDNLGLAKRAGLTAEAMAALTNMVSAELELGRYADALLTAREAMILAEEASHVPHRAAAHLNLGRVYFELGRHDRAAAEWTTAANLARDCADTVTEAKALSNLGVLRMMDGRTAGAREALHRLRAVAARSGQRELERLADCNLALADVWDGRPAALAVLRRIADRATADGDGHTELHARAMLVLALASVGDTAGVRAEAGKLRDRADAAKSTKAWFAHHMLGEADYVEKNWAAAATHYRAAATLSERRRQSVREPELQAAQADRFLLSRPYTRLAECLVELGDPAGALAAAERGKARTLAELLQTGRVDVTRGLTPAERRREAELDRAVTEKTNAHEAVKLRKPGENRVKAARAALDTAAAELAAFRQAAYLAHPELQTARAAFAPATLAELGATVFRGRPGLVVLSYLVGNDHTLLFVLTSGDTPGGPAKLVVRPVNATADELAEATRDLRVVCESPAGSPVAGNLCRWLLDPAEPELKRADHVLIVPDGVLHTLPFQALKPTDGGKYLIERYAVSYAPSLTALVAMYRAGDAARARHGVGGTLLAVGIVDFGPRQDSLPNAEAEAGRVAGLFSDRSRTLLGAAATRDNLRACWAAPRFFHLATHGELNEASPFDSAVVLSRAGPGDPGQLTGRDLLAADLGAELAVLSACHSGAGRVLRGEGLLGLSWAWFVAGVPGLVVGQWKVVDDSTRTLMEAFWAEVGRGTPRAEALRRAQLSVLKNRKTAKPYFWAPFVLVGDPGPP
jgi:CHAT domain-containing protein